MSFDEPKCFDSMMAYYGKFGGVENYIALVGKKSDSLDEKAGYYGEKLACDKIHNSRKGAKGVCLTK